MNIYEVFINMYVSELSRIVKQGMFLTYVNKEENIHTVKGKILVGNNIKKNIVHKEKFFCSYHEYEIDNPENRIIKSTLLKLLSISNDNENIRNIKRLLLNFDSVSNTSNYQAEFERIVLNRKNKEYEYILDWSKTFLKNKSFTNFSGDNKGRALLFKMEKVFESYVAKRVKHEMGEGYNAIIKDQSKYLFDEPQKNFKLEPDIIIEGEDNKVVAILDTKWKNLIDKAEESHYNISIHDMYQMLGYARRYNINNVILVYPINDEMKEYDNKKPIVYKNEDVTITTFFIKFNIDSKNRVEDNIKDLINLIRKSI